MYIYVKYILNVYFYYKYVYIYIHIHMCGKIVNVYD